jgi:hypothetical protein
MRSFACEPQLKQELIASTKPAEQKSFALRAEFYEIGDTRGTKAHWKQRTEGRPVLRADHSTFIFFPSYQNPPLYARTRWYVLLGWYQARKGQGSGWTVVVASNCIELLHIELY